MGTTTHTPGPWTWGHNVDSSRAVITAPDSAEQGIIGTVNLCRGGSEADGEANARLVAAAPELLAVVRRRLAYCRERYIAGFQAYLQETHELGALLARIDGTDAPAPAGGDRG